MKKYTLFLMLLFFSACSSNSLETLDTNQNSNEETTSIDVVIGENMAGLVFPSQITSIELKISAPDITTIIPTITGPITLPVSFSSVTVPIGTARTFEVIVHTSIGSHAIFYGITTTNIPTVSGEVPINVTWHNFVEDDPTTADVVSAATNTPNIIGVEIFPTGSSASSPCVADQIKTVIKLQPDFVAPISSVDGNIKTIIEFDIDNSRITGSSVSLIQTKRGVSAPTVLGSNMTDGTELALDINGPIGTSPGTISGTAVDPVTATPITTIPITGNYDATSKTINVCMPATGLFGIDPDHTGVFNVLTGRDVFGIYTPNDIAYQGGPSINYNLNNPLFPIPTGP